MSSITQERSLTQDPAHTKQLVDAKFLPLVAEALYRFDRRRPDALLSELDLESQRRYLDDATLMTVMRDPERMRPALYDATNELVPSGIGSLSQLQRLMAVNVFTSAFKVLRDSLGGRRPASTALMAKLAQADRASEHLTTKGPVNHG